ncbi:hypothetical protein Tco_0565963 [Tanacetum coccineum]
MQDEADAIRSCIAQTTVVISKLQAMEDQDEVHDSLLVAKDVKRGEKSIDLNNDMRFVKIRRASRIYNLGSSMPRLCPYGGRVLEISSKLWFLTMAALYILDKLSEVANSSQLEDKMKVVFSRARDSDESFIDLLRDLCSAIRDSTRVGVLEQLLAGAHVGMRLKAEYAADMGETV